MKYEYQMVQIPPNISVAAKNNHGNVAANYLQGVVDEYAGEGWQFHRVDQVGVETKPGCIAAFFGSKALTSYYYVISFRRAART